MGTQDRSDHLLKTALFDMEIPVRDIRAWAEAIHVVGATEREVDADVVVVMARALEGRRREALRPMAEGHRPIARREDLTIGPAAILRPGFRISRRAEHGERQ